MARIRSVHPGQWNDDDFLECSPMARLLCLAVRNFADDNGVFEWKPRQIKRLCLPSDACDVLPLLKELVDHKQVVQFEEEGKEYGAIRNFRPWQRPKTPKSQYPCPPSIRKYVGLTHGDFGNGEASRTSISEMDDDNEPPIPRNGEITLPMEEGGDSRKEEGDKTLAPEALEFEIPEFLVRKPKAKEPDRFDEFYAAYPKHVGRGAAEKAWRAAQKLDTVDAIIAGARRYALDRAGQDPNFTAHPATWLNQKRWLDEAGGEHVNGHPSLDKLQESRERLIKLGQRTERIDRAIAERHCGTEAA